MATQLGIYREALRILANHDIASTSEDVEARYVLDAAYSDAITHCLTLGWWKFAFSTVAPTLSAASVPSGYTRKFATSDISADWLRTHSVGLAVGTRFIPIDWYQQGTTLAVKYSANVVVKFIKGGATEVNPANWPMPFSKLVAGYLAYDVALRLGVSTDAAVAVFKEFQDRLALARESESYPPPMRLPEHAVERVTRSLLEQGFWRFSMKTAAPITAATAKAGYAHGFDIATDITDLLRIYDVSVSRNVRLYPVDWVTEGGTLSAQYDEVKVTYVSSSYVDPSTWTEAFAQAVDLALTLEDAKASGAGSPEKIAQLKAQLDQITDAALGKDRLPRPLNLPPGTVDRVVRSLLEDGTWRFSIKEENPASTTAPANGYVYAYTPASDLLRIVDVTYETGGRLRPVDWFATPSKISAQLTPIRVRYVSDDFADPLQWPDSFAKVVESFLAIESARAHGDPPERIEAAKVQLEAALSQAAAKDRIALPRQLPEHAVQKTVRNLLETGFWRFSLKSATLSTTTGPASGYVQAFLVPSDLLRIYDVVYVTSDKVRPLDWVHVESKISASQTSARIRYVSSDYIDPATWPAAFAHVVDCALALETVRNDAPEKIEAAKLQYETALQQAINKDRLPPPVVLPEHCVQKTVRDLLENQFWRFSIKVNTPVTTTGPADGYVQAFTAPADALRIYDAGTEIAGDKLRPVDWLHVGSKISASLASIRIRYVSSDYTDPSTWPEAFAAVIDARLAWERARAASLPSADIEAAKAQIEKLLDQAKNKECLPAPTARPEHAVQKAARRLLEDYFWRFSVKESSPVSSGTPASGYSTAFPVPADAMRLYDAVTVASSKIRPIDWIQVGSTISAQNASIRIRYVSTDYIAPSTWTESFAAAVDAYLALQDAQAMGSPAEQVQMARTALDQLLAQAKDKEILPALMVRPEHSVQRSARRLLEDGFWRFSILTATPSSTTGPASGYSTAYTIPSDFLRMYEVGVERGGRFFPIDWHVEGTTRKLSTNHGANVRMRYVSSTFVDPQYWTDAFAEAVDAHVNLEIARSQGADKAAIEAAAAQAERLLAAAEGKDRLPRPLIMPYGAVKTVLSAMLETGLWKFAVKTVPLNDTGKPPSGAYAYTMDKPADWLRTILVFKIVGTEERACDFRDENDAIHVDDTPVYLRYVSTDGVDPTSGWTELFYMAFEAGLEYEAGRIDDRLSEGEKQGRYARWRRLLAEARVKDGQNERPRVTSIGKFNAARGGWTNREQGY